MVGCPHGYESLRVFGECGKHFIANFGNKFRLPATHNMCGAERRVRIDRVLLTQLDGPFNSCRVLMSHGEQFDIAVIIQQVDGAPVGQLWYDEASSPGKRGLVIERGSKDFAGFTEKARSLFCPLALRNVAVHDENADGFPISVTYQGERDQDIERSAVTMSLYDLGLPAALLRQRLPPVCPPSLVIGESGLHDLHARFPDDLFFFPTEELFSRLVPVKITGVHICNGDGFRNTVETCPVEEFCQVALHVRCVFPDRTVLCNTAGLRIHLGKNLIRAITVEHATKTPSPRQDGVAGPRRYLQQIHVLTAVKAAKTAY